MADELLGKRTIEFPAERSLGTLHVGRMEALLRTSARVLDARGRVTIEDGELVELETATSTDLAPLTRLAANALWGITVAGSESERVMSETNLGHLARISGLDHLSLHGLSTTDAGFSALAALSKLKSLSISFMFRGITDGGFAAVARMENLEHLYLFGVPVGDAAVAYLGPLGQLVHLELSNTFVTDNGLATISRLPQLERLGIMYTQGTSRLTDTALAHISNLTSLEHLSLYDTNTSDTGLAYIQGLVSLQYLALRGPRMRITDAGLLHIQSLGKLRTLDVEGLKDVTEAGISRLRRPGLTCTGPLASKGQD